MLIYGDMKIRILFKLITDPESTLDSIASSRLVEKKLSRMIIKDLKVKFLKGEVIRYAWQMR